MWPSLLNRNTKSSYCTAAYFVSTIIYSAFIVWCKYVTRSHINCVRMEWENCVAIFVRLPPTVCRHNPSNCLAWCCKGRCEKAPNSTTDWQAIKDWKLILRWRVTVLQQYFIPRWGTYPACLLIWCDTAGWVSDKSRSCSVTWPQSYNSKLIIAMCWGNVFIW